MPQESKEDAQETYTDLEIENWVQRDRAWEMLDDWQKYLLASRQSYLLDRQTSLGLEYFNSPNQWDSIFEREWAIIEERMNAGIGVPEEILSLYGEDFFQDKDKLLEEIHQMMPHKKEEVDSDNSYYIYPIEDFIMLFNQGIFRDKVFLIDPQRKWRKKVEEIMNTYGFNTIEWMTIRGDNYLFVQG